MYRAPRGAKDILPDEQPWWEHVDRTAADLLTLYGFRRIDTPIFEEADLFVRSVGEATDVAEKETYTFEDRGGDLLSLRPEGTAGVARAYVEHGMHVLPQPVRLYSTRLPMFRYDRPQAGGSASSTSSTSRCWGRPTPRRTWKSSRSRGVSSPT